MAKPLPNLDRETTGLKVFPLFTILGWGLIGLAVLVSIIFLGPIGSSYFGENAKAARDAAAAGQPLLSDLRTLAWWPKFLAPLIFLGVASFMVGIALEFAAIPNIIQRRIEVLKEAIPLMGRN